MYKPLVLVNEVNEPLFFSAGQVKDTLDNGSKIGKDNYRWPVIYSKGSVKEPERRWKRVVLFCGNHFQLRWSVGNFLYSIL